MAMTVEEYKKWAVNLVKDLRSPDKVGMQAIINDGEQKKIEYDDARKDAARTGNADDIARAKRLKGILEVYDGIVKSRDLTTKAQSIYENIDSNRKKLESLTSLGEGNTEESKKIKRQLDRARAELQTVETERDAFGTNPKGPTPEVKVKSKGSSGPSGSTGPSGASGTAGMSGSTGASGPSGATGPSGTLGSKGASGASGSTAKKKYTTEEIYDLVAKEYGAIDALFRTNPDLKKLVTDAMGPDKVPGTDDDYTINQFTNMLKNTDWFKSTAGEVQQRGFLKRQYLDVKTRASATELAAIEKDNAYARGVANTKLLVKEQARLLGSTLDPVELDSIALDIYDNANEGNDAVIRSLLRAKIQYSKDKTMGGAAGENLAALKATAAANGINLEQQYGTSLQGWLQNISQGESVETYKQIIRGAAKLGMPDKVAGLLDQGVDLATIYSPYKQMMASVLEINPESITLNDAVLRSAIGPDKETSLYDFQRQLRKDSRWQYTDQARGEVSKIAKNVLQDFGFQG